MSDPVLDLARRLDAEEAEFRAADDRHDFATADNHHQVAVLLRDRFAQTLPTTREGIAVKLERAEAVLSLEAEASDVAEVAELGAVAERIRQAAPTTQDQCFLLFHAAHPGEMCARSPYAASLIRSAARAACRPTFALAA